MGQWVYRADVPDRVVVTGMGAVTPLARTTEETWRGALVGRNGVSPIVAFDTTDFPAKIAAQVLDWDAAGEVGKRTARRTDRFTQFALKAAREAIDHSGLEITEENRRDIGVFIGSGIGGLVCLQSQFEVLHERGPTRVSPFTIPSVISNMASGMVSIEHGFEGPNMAIVTACASGAHSVGEAAEVIKRGDAEVMIAGGAEAAITPLGLAGFCAGRALATRYDAPERASRPFDRERDGFVPGEGAGILVLESYEHASRRGANIRAEIVGYGVSGDGFHMTQPPESGYGALRSMKKALRNARLEPESIDYINAHGTSTRLGDLAETNAVKTIFSGKVAAPMSSTKSMMGHLIGAAGAVELVLCILAIRDGQLPPTINLEHSDPDCDLDYVPNETRAADVRYAMSNSFGFGGHNASLIVGRV